MSSKRKMIFRIIPILLLAIVLINFGSTIFAVDPETIFNPSNIPGRDESNTITNVDNSVKSIWSTVILVLQIASVAAFVLAGVRYMFASADTRANIKQQVFILIIGAIFVFASSTVVKFIVESAKDVLKS